MEIENHTIIFTPSESFHFTLDIPPFESFLIERVLNNMRKTDQERSTNGELDPSEVLEYAVQDQEGKLTSLTIHNYGGERRLREINSSIRWTFDKMYDKLTQG
jgi:ribosomal protein L11